MTISSISGGGKTTVSKALSKQLENSEVWYFDELDHFVQFPKNFPHSEISEYGLTKLKAYFDSYEKQKDIVIFDYPFGRAHYEFRDLIDLAIFLDTPEETALFRRVERDQLNYEEELKSYKSVRKAYQSFTEVVKPSCDLIIDGSLPIEEITKSIIRDMKI